MKFLIVALFYVGYIVGDNIVYSLNWSNLSNYFLQMNELNIRPILYKYEAIMTYEIAANDPLYNIPSINL